MERKVRYIKGWRSGGPGGVKLRKRGNGCTVTLNE